MICSLQSVDLNLIGAYAWCGSVYPAFITWCESAGLHHHLNRLLAAVSSAPLQFRIGARILVRKVRLSCVIWVLQGW